MDLSLSGEQLALKQKARDFAEREIAPIAAEIDEDREFPLQVYRKMADEGLIGLSLPKKYGGGGTDYLSFLVVVEELARVDANAGLLVGSAGSLATTPVLLLGTEDQKQRWLVPIAQGKMLGAFGLTEPGAGSDAKSITTTAILADNVWIINGTKRFISNAGTKISGFVIVFAITGERENGKKEYSSILVPKDTPGYVLEEPYRLLGGRSLDVRELKFIDCRVPFENLLGERGGGFRQLASGLNDGRLTYGAIGTGVAQGCYEMALRHAQERVQFGQPIFQFQAIKFKLADMAMAIELSRLMYYKTAILREEGKPYIKEAAMAKLFATETATKVVWEAMQIHGGESFIEDHPLCRFYRGVRLFTIGEGTSEILRLVIAERL